MNNKYTAAIYIMHVTVCIHVLLFVSFYVNYSIMRLMSLILLLIIIIIIIIIIIFFLK